MGKSHQLIRIVAPLAKSVITFFHNVQFEGLENLPASGMLLPKHSYMRDTPLLALALMYKADRSAYWLMREFWPGVDWLCRNCCGALRVYRPIDIREKKPNKHRIKEWKESNLALEAKIADLLSQKELVVVYPEGHCGYEKMLPMHMRYVNVAVRYSSPIVPIGTEYCENKCIFRIGNPLLPPYPENLDQCLGLELAKLSNLATYHSAIRNF